MTSSSPSAPTADPPPVVDPRDVALALDIAFAAGQITLGWYGGAGLEVRHKSDGTPVTQADTEAETYVSRRLADERPEDGLVGEEHGDRAGSSGRRWIVDPIDGTKSFARGVPLYATLLALEDDHGTAIGVIHLPALDETVWAVRGGGCYWNGDLCRVSVEATVTGSYLMTSGVDHWSRSKLDAVFAAGLIVRTWGDAYGYALVATGRAEAMVDPEVSLWDVAPMPVILAEAGGRFTAVDGRPGAGHGSGLATNGALHDDLVALLTTG